MVMMRIRKKTIMIKLIMMAIIIIIYLLSISLSLLHFIINSGSFMVSSTRYKKSSLTLALSISYYKCYHYNWYDQVTSKWWLSLSWMNSSNTVAVIFKMEFMSCIGSTDASFILNMTIRRQNKVLNNWFLYQWTCHIALHCLLVWR